MAGNDESAGLAASGSRRRAKASSARFKRPMAVAWVASLALAGTSDRDQFGRPSSLNAYLHWVQGYGRAGLEDHNTVHCTLDQQVTSLNPPSLPSIFIRGLSHSWISFDPYTEVVHRSPPLPRSLTFLSHHIRSACPGGARRMGGAGTWEKLQGLFLLSGHHTGQRPPRHRRHYRPAGLPRHRAHGPPPCKARCREDARDHTAYHRSNTQTCLSHRWPSGPGTQNRQE